MNGIRLGRLFGIEISIHPSWFVILFLFTFTLATAVFPNDWSTATSWTAAIIATVLLFASVIAHELGHSLVARAQGIKVKSITLFLLGGVASIEKETATPGREALMAAVGPAVSLGIGGLALGIAALLPGPETVVAVTRYLGVANVALAIFNLLPGFPLDGGRILRALLWKKSRNFTRATKQANRVGQIFGIALIVLGAVEIIIGQNLGGIWIAFVGWVVMQAARTAAGQAILVHALSGVTTQAVMSPIAAWVSPYVTLAHVAEGHFDDFDSRCLAVHGEGLDHEYEGLLCRHDLLRGAGNMESARVRDVMVSIDRLAVVHPDAPADEALRLLREADADRLAVVAGEGHLVGYVDEVSFARYALRSGAFEPAAN